METGIDSRPAVQRRHPPRRSLIRARHSDAQEQQLAAIGSKQRVGGSREVGSNRHGGAPRRGDYKNMSPTRPSHIGVAVRKREVSDLLSVRREAGPAASGGDELLVPTQGRDRVNASAVSFGPECDPGPVGRKNGRGGVSLVFGEANRRATAAHLFHPEVEVAFARAIRRVDEEFAIGRNGWVGVKALVKR